MVKPFLVVIFFIAFILRMALVFSAYHGDLNNNISWGQIAYSQGLAGFYGSDKGEDWPYSAPNQPPLTILIFAGLAGFYDFIYQTSWSFNQAVQFFPSGIIWFLEEKGMTLLVKLPSIISDLAIGLLLFNYFHERKNIKAAYTSSLVWLFNPAIWYNSSIWGQTDSVVNFLGLLAIVNLIKKRFVIFVALFTLSLLFKGSLIIFAPVLAYLALRQKYNLKTYLGGLVTALVIIFWIGIWFHPYFDFPVWFINLYVQRILPGEIGYLTANAFNFWWLVDSGKTLDSSVFLGLSAQVWGVLLTVAGILTTLFLFRKKYSEKNIWLALGLTVLVAFLFMTRMHERYLYPFFVPGTILLGFYPILIIPYFVLSMSHLLNLYHLFWEPPLPLLISLYKNDWFIPLISLVNIFFLPLLLYFFVKVGGKEKKGDYLV